MLVQLIVMEDYRRKFSKRANNVSKKITCIDFSCKHTSRIRGIVIGRVTQVSHFRFEKRKQNNKVTKMHYFLTKKEVCVCVRARAYIYERLLSQEKVNNGGGRGGSGDGYV